jgi:predicted RNA-binding protein YlqC (UPF0109 family)
MRKLLEFLVTKITGVKDFTIEEETEGNFTRFIIRVKPEEAGLIIGKGGKTIKIIKNLLRIRAILEQHAVAVSVEEQT